MNQQTFSASVERAGDGIKLVVEASAGSFEFAATAQQAREIVAAIEALLGSPFHRTARPPARP